MTLLFNKPRGTPRCILCNCDVINETTHARQKHSANIATGKVVGVKKGRNTIWYYKQEKV